MEGVNGGEVAKWRDDGGDDLVCGELIVQSLLGANALGK